MTRQIGVRVPTDLLAAVDQMAEDTDRTRSYVIVHLLTALLKKRIKKGGKG